MNSLEDWYTFIWALYCGYLIARFGVFVIWKLIVFLKTLFPKRKYSTVKPSSSVSLFANHIHGVEPLFEYHFKRRERIKPEIYTNRELSNISKAEAEWMDKQMKEVKKEKLIDTFDEAEIIEETKNQQTKLE